VPAAPQGLADLDGEKQEVEQQLQECAEEAAQDLGLQLDKTIKWVAWAVCFLPFLA
jgi:hypothetical protein